MNPKKTILDLSPQHARRRAGWWRRLSAAGLTLGLACLIQPANAQQGPAPTTGSFGAAVLADTPVAFWQLNEIGDAATNGLHAYDFTGHGYSGTYGADAYIWTNGVSAPQPPTYSGFATNQGALLPTVSDANSVVTLPPLNLNTNEVTFLMWINPSANEATYTGLLMNRTPAADAAGIGFGGGQNGSGQAELGYTWNDNSGSTYGFHSALYPQVGNWSLAALVIESNQATLYLDYIDQSTGLTVLSSAVNSLAHTAEAFSGGATMLGSDVVNGNAADSTRVFAGDISDAAVFNYALSAAQINALFGAGIGQQGFPPSITGQPASQYVLAGTTTQFKATGIDGSAPFAYQWTLNSSPIAASNTNFTGVNSNTLTVDRKSVV